ncbi:MAG: universal stress protein [Candidatus Methanomethyliaceae archaeon]|nr:universal stress protein [Candidatus Methanomethyliaceae archaeon]MDW7971376.1 universal stress protein [Nitrososphaerota archaeon]
MYKKILVGVDGSESSKKACEVAVELAKKLGSELIIATIYSAPTIPIGDVPPYPPTVPKEVEEKLKVMLKELEDYARKEGVKAESKILPVWATPGAGLVVEADRLGCALIVIGSRGLTGIKRALIGSVADYVVKNSGCSVLIVR